MTGEWRKKGVTHSLGHFCSLRMSYAQLPQTRKGAEGSQPERWSLECPDVDLHRPRYVMLPRAP